MVKQENTKVEGGTTPKDYILQQTNSTRKATFRAPTYGLKDKAFDLIKQIYYMEFVKNWEATSKFIVVNYKQGGPKTAMAINNTENPTITVPEILEETSNKVAIFIWDNKYKE